MAVPYLQVDNLTKSFGDLVLFENISFGIAEGQRVGLIAKNGSGKTTLLNIIAGKEGYDSGNIVFRRDLRVDYLEQDPQYPEELTVLEACFHHGNSTVELIKEYERCMETEGHPGLEDLLARMDQEKAWEYEQKAKQILSQLKIRNFDQRVKQLSGGQLKRVALANALITEPDLLILDEPTNHLDLDMTEWLEDYLRRTNLSLLMVTHDRYFLDRVCSEIIEIDNQQIYQYKGNYSYYLEKRQERIEAKSVEIERANNLYRTELDWMRRMPQARGHKARYREDAQVAHARIAIATSHVVGKGPGNSIQRDFLSQAFSDFIFAIVIEEMGLIGGIFVVFLYLWLLMRAGRIAQKCERTFPAFLVMGIALLLVSQAILNMMVAVGLFPVTGQPLPLVSKGGTSTLINCAYIGMILSVSRYTAHLEEQKAHDAQIQLQLEADAAASSEAQTAAEPTAQILNSDAKFEDEHDIDKR